MKLSYWRIVGLPIHQGFNITGFDDVPGRLKIALVRQDYPRIGVTIRFENYHSAMHCDEFAMNSYVSESPTMHGGDGSNFFRTEDSEFRKLLLGGDVNFPNIVSGYVVVDSDYWIEVLAKYPPDVQIVRRG